MNVANILPIDDERRFSSPEGLMPAKLKDFLWVADFFTRGIKQIQMWVGWNSLLASVSGKQQKIWYLPQINESPTSYCLLH